MSLRENDDIINNNTNNPKKSILKKRIDFFLLLVILIALVTPLISGLFAGTKIPVNNDVNLFLSAQCENFFGKELTEILIHEFEGKNPGVKIVIADGEPRPDIFIFNDGDYNELVSNGALAGLNSFTNYDSGAPQLAIPLVSFMNLLFYNINILTDAGFDSPPKTREQFTAYARTVSRGGSGAAGAALSLNIDDHRALTRDIFSWIWAGGGDFWAESGAQQNQNAPSFNSRSLINDIVFLETLNREGSLAQGIFDITGEKIVRQFAEGKIALMIASTQVIPYLREKLGDDAFGITTIPGSGAGNYRTGLSAVYAAISAECENAEPAWDFLVFLTEKSSLFCAELKAVPGIVSNIIPGDYVKDDPFYSKAWEIFEASQIAEGFTGKPGADKFETIFMEELRSFFERSRTAQQTVSAIQQRWSEVSADIEYTGDKNFLD